MGEVEAGRAPRIAAQELVSIVAALGGNLMIRIVYQGEGLDRLRDRRHAALVNSMVELLRAAGWEVATEVSFSVYGERGSVDILALHPVTGTLLMIEVKTVVPDIGECWRQSTARSAWHPTTACVRCRDPATTSTHDLSLTPPQRSSIPGQRTA